MKNLEMREISNKKIKDIKKAKGIKMFSKDIKINSRRKTSMTGANRTTLKISAKNFKSRSTPIRNGPTTIIRITLAKCLLIINTLLKHSRLLRSKPFPHKTPANTANSPSPSKNPSPNSANPKPTTNPNTSPSSNWTPVPHKLNT
jgi:hypothetical protein